MRIAWVVSKTKHQWTVDCPYCSAYHLHSPGEGARSAHCVAKPADAPTYDVRLSR